jgi:arylformamidase
MIALAQEASMGGSWIDITTPTAPGMAHWPGDPPPHIERLLDLDRGHPCAVSRLEITSHTGTHVDAPRHLIATGAGADDMPFDAMMGVARVIEIHDPASITVTELAGAGIRRRGRVLFKTRSSPGCNTGVPRTAGPVTLSLPAAHWLAERRLRLIGIDGLSIETAVSEDLAVHRTLLTAGVWILEGLDLAAVAPGRYELVCLPLRLTGGDGAPARVLLRPLARRSPARRAGERSDRGRT